MLFGLFGKKEEKKCNHSCTEVYGLYKKYYRLYEEADVLLMELMNKVKFYKSKLDKAMSKGNELLRENERLRAENEALKKDNRINTLLLKDLYDELKKKNEKESSIDKKARETIAKIEKLATLPKDDRIENVKKRVNRKEEILEEVEELEEKVELNKSTLDKVRETLARLDTRA